MPPDSCSLINPDHGHPAPRANQHGRTMVVRPDHIEKGPLVGGLLFMAGDTGPTVSQKK